MISPQQLKKVGKKRAETLLKHCLIGNECSKGDTCCGLSEAERQVWGKETIFPGELIGAKSERTSMYLVRWY